MATGRAGARLKLPVSAVPPGSGQGARDPGNAPRTGAAGPGSRECSAPAGSSGRGAPRLPGGPGHRPTSTRGWEAGSEAWGLPGWVSPVRPVPRQRPARAHQRGAGEVVHIKRVSLLLQVQTPCPHVPGEFGTGTPEPGQGKGRCHGSMLSRSTKMGGECLQRHRAGGAPTLRVPSRGMGPQC